MVLTAAVENLTAVLSSGKGDSQAQQLELLHEIELQVRIGPVEELKATQDALEKQLTAALLQGPAPPLRHLISSIFVWAYGRGVRQGMYNTVGLMLSWMSNKSSPASSVASKAAILTLLGELSHSHGPAMVALCHDSIGLLTKSIRAPEIPLRITACTALASALNGSGGIPAAIQQEALKNVKHVIAERGAPPELRAVCVSCCVSLITYSEALWSSDMVEQVRGAPASFFPACTAPLAV